MIAGNKKLRLVEWCLLLYVFLIPLEDFFLQEVIGSSTRIAGAALILIYFIFESGMQWKISPKSFYLYFSWATLSILIWANNPDYYAIFRLLMWMLTTMVIANIISRNIALLPLLFKAYITASLYLVFIAIRNFTGMDAEELERVDVEGINQNLLASQFLICIIYLFYNYFRSKFTALYKSISIGLILLFVLGVIATGSRSALFSVILAFLLILPKRSFNFSTIIQLSALVIFTIFLFTNDNYRFTQFLTSRIEAAETDKGANRIIVWKVAESMIKDKTFIGVGYRNFPTEFSTYLKRTDLDVIEWERIGERNVAGTHNSLLETLSELGIVGFLLFYGFQYKLIRRLNQYKTAQSVLAITLLLAINFNALFGDLANLKYFWLTVGICLGIITYAINKKNISGYALSK